MARGDHGGSPLHLAPILLLLLCLHLPGTVSRGDMGMDGEQLEPLPSGVDAGMEPKGFLKPQIHGSQGGPPWSYGRPFGSGENGRPDGGQFGSYGKPFGGAYGGPYGKPFGGAYGSPYGKPFGGAYGSPYGKPFGGTYGGSTYGSSEGSGSYGGGGSRPMVYGRSCSEVAKQDGSGSSGSSCPGSGEGGVGVPGASSSGSSGGDRPRPPGKSCHESSASGGSGSSRGPCSRPPRGGRIELFGQGGPNTYPGSSSGPSGGYISGSHDRGRSESYLGGSSRSAWGGRRNQPGASGAAGSGSYGNAELGDSAGGFLGDRASSSSGHTRLQAKPSGIPYILGISGLGRRTGFIPVHKKPENSGTGSPSGSDGLLRPHDKDPDVPSEAPLSERLNLGNTDYHSPGNAADAADEVGAGMGSGDVAISGSDFSDPTVHSDA